MEEQPENRAVTQLILRHIVTVLVDVNFHWSGGGCTCYLGVQVAGLK